MKLIRLIAALYVLSLAVYPCSDGNTCIDEQRTGIAVNEADDHQHNNAEQDLCTPFCICSCCAAHIQLSATQNATGISLIHNTSLLTPYTEKASLDKSNAIWQPPRFS